MMKLSAREMKTSDIELIINYFTNATPEFLLGMGVEKIDLRTIYAKPGIKYNFE